MANSIEINDVAAHSVFEMSEVAGKSSLKAEIATEKTETKVVALKEHEKKGRLMPTNTVVNNPILNINTPVTPLDTPANQSVSAASSANAVTPDSDVNDSHLSIWYLLAKFFSDSVIKINEKEESAAMSQVAAQAKVLANAGQNIANINPQLTNDTHADGLKSTLVGVGVTLAGLLLAVPTCGLSLVAAGLVDADLMQKYASPNSKSFLDSMDLGFVDKGLSAVVDEQGPDTTDLQKAANTQVTWSNVATQANQQEQTTMQLHVTQVAQIIAQAAQQFSQMITSATQAAVTSLR